MAIAENSGSIDIGLNSSHADWTDNGSQSSPVTAENSGSTSFRIQFPEFSSSMTINKNSETLDFDSQNSSVNVAFAKNLGTTDFSRRLLFKFGNLKRCEK